MEPRVRYANRRIMARDCELGLPLAGEHALTRSRRGPAPPGTPEIVDDHAIQDRDDVGSLARAEGRDLRLGRCEYRQPRPAKATSVRIVLGACLL